VTRRTTQVARYHFHAGELDRAERMLEGVLGSAPDGRPKAEALRLLAEIRSYGRGMWESAPLFEQALEHAGDDVATQAAIELDLAFLVEQMGNFDAALEHGRRAAALAERVGDPGLLAEAMAVVEVAGFITGLGSDGARMDRALDLEDVNREMRIEMRPSLIAAYLALYAGELQRSVELLTKLRDRIVERGQESDLPYVLSYMSWAESWRGNLPAGEKTSEASIATSARLGLKSLECFSHAMGAFVAAYAGDEATARSRAARSHRLADETGVRIATLWADWAIAILALSKGDAQEAADVLAPITAVVEEHGLPEPVRVPSLPESIEALISTGQLDRAERLLEILDAAATRLARTWALAAASRCRALLLAAHGQLEAASAVASEAIERGTRLELRFDLARSLLVAGQVERRRRRKREAARRLSEALEIFEMLGAQLWAARTRRELNRVRGNRSGEGLTATEQRVAELAASGQTNLQVAAALFISPKTVEANLARVYGKLGIHSRAELGARLGNPRSGGGDG
jgi:DNA-binding CsgD family transcriptional regulator